MPNVSFWMYILECGNGAYYVGKANNLHYRIDEHSGAIASARHSRYVKAKGFRRIVYFEEFSTERAALRREYSLKHWHPTRYVRRDMTPVRAYKDYLVESFPEWKLAAFHEADDDESFRNRLRAGHATALPQFTPLDPTIWWTQLQSDVERAKIAAVAAENARFQEYLRRPRKRSYAILWFFGFIVLWVLLEQLGRR